MLRLFEVEVDKLLDLLRGLESRHKESELAVDEEISWEVKESKRLTTCQVPGYGKRQTTFLLQAQEATHMPGSPYRALRIILGIFSVLTAIGGLVIIFSGRPLMMRLFLRPPESEVSTLLLFALKEMGGFVLMLSAMLFFAYRDPARNVAIVNAFIVGLCILAFTPLWSLYTLDIRHLYPAYLIWGRSLVRLALAALLFYLRPREGAGEKY